MPEAGGPLGRENVCFPLLVENVWSQGHSVTDQKCAVSEPLCIYSYKHLWIPMYVYIYKFLGVLVIGVPLYESIYTSPYMYTYMYTCVYVCVLCLCTLMYMCSYVLACAYIYMHVYNGTCT